MSSTYFDSGFMPSLVFWRKVDETGRSSYGAKAVRDASKLREFEEVLAAVPLDPKLSTATVDALEASADRRISALDPHAITEEDIQYTALVAVQSVAERSRSRDFIANYVERSTEKGRAVSQCDPEAQDEVWEEVFACIKSARGDADEERWRELTEDWEQSDEPDAPWNYIGEREDFLNAAGDALQEAWEQNPMHTYQFIHDRMPDMLEHPEKNDDLGTFSDNGLKEVVRLHKELHDTLVISRRLVAEDVDRNELQEEDWLNLFAYEKDLPSIAQVLQAKTDKAIEERKRKAQAEAVIVVGTKEASEFWDSCISSAIGRLKQQNALPFVSETMKASILQVTSQPGSCFYNPYIKAEDFDALCTAVKILKGKNFNRELVSGWVSFSIRLEETVRMLHNGDDREDSNLAGYPTDILEKALRQVIRDDAGGLTKGNRDLVESNPKCCDLMSIAKLAEKSKSRGGRS